MDMATITMSFEALKKLHEVVTYLLNKKIDAETKEKLNLFLKEYDSIKDKLYSLRDELLKIQEENHKLKEENKQLNEKLQIKENLSWEPPFYWLIEGDSKDGPFCQRCYDSDKKLIRIQGGKNDAWRCYECKETYFGSNYKKKTARIMAVRTTRRR